MMPIPKYMQPLTREEIVHISSNTLHGALPMETQLRLIATAVELTDQVENLTNKLHDATVPPSPAKKSKGRRPPEPNIDLNELLHNNPTWADVVDFWKQGEFHEEHYLVDAILKYLLTPDQSARMSRCGITIEDVLNGRCRGEGSQLREKLCSEWNEKLGFKAFTE